MAVFTESERVEVWDRRQGGESNRSIDCDSGVRRRRFGRSRKLRVGCGRRFGTGRFGTCLWWSGRRSRVASLLASRFAVLARRFGRAPSTLSREVARNGGRHRYRAHRADRAAWQRSRRAKPYRLASNHALRAIVEEVVADRWSPQQIASWLARTHPDDVPWMRAAANANWKEVRGGVRPNAQSFPSSAYVAGRRLARSDISCEQWTTRASARVASGPRTRCRALTAAAPTLPPRRGSALTPPNQKRERISEPLSA